METLTYQPPLRAAIRWCIELRKGAVPIDTLAAVAQVELPRARAYASILLGIGVLEATEVGVIPGPKWDEWMARPSRTRPVSSRCEAADAMDRMRRAMSRNVQRLAAERGWTLIELARRSQVPHPYLYRLRRTCDPLPACALILVARALGVPAEELVVLPA